MRGELDPFDFALAERLGRTVAEMRDSISNAEYLQWGGFYQWRAEQQERSRR